MRGKAFLAWLVLGTSVVAAWAGPGGSVRVTGQGQDAATPDTAEVAATIGGDAELAADALTKFRSARKRLDDTLTALNLPQLKVHELGLQIGSGAGGTNLMQAMMRGDDDAQVKTGFQVSQNLKVAIAGVDKMTPEALTEILVRVLDALKDAGANVGVMPSNVWEMQVMQQMPQGQVVFVLTDGAAPRAKAYALAMEDARGKALQLARLAGGQLGAVVSVHESATPKNDDDAAELLGSYAAALMRSAASHRNDQFGPVPVRVTLDVTFELLRPEAQP